MRTFWTTYLPGPLAAETAVPFLESFQSAKIPEKLLLCHDGPDGPADLPPGLLKNVVTRGLADDGMLLAWRENFADRLERRPGAVDRFKWVVAVVTALNDFAEPGGIGQGSPYDAVVYLAHACRFKTRLAGGVFARAVKDNPVTVDSRKRPSVVCYRLTSLGREALLTAVEYHMQGRSIDDGSLAETLAHMHGGRGSWVMREDARLIAAAGP
jgi:hypothetical protein